MLKLKNDRIRTLLLESVLIVFSVMLGLLGNDVRESINKKNTANYALNNIVQEISRNKTELKKSLGRQDSLYKTIQKFVMKKPSLIKSKVTFYSILHNAGGINIPTISTSAWETAVNTGATENFDYGQILRLTQIDEETKWIHSISLKILNLIYNENMFDPHRSVILAKTMMLPIIDLISSEKNLLDAYNHFNI